MAFTTVFAFTPQGGVSAKAATSSDLYLSESEMHYNPEGEFNWDESCIRIEKGETFYVGDGVYFYTKSGSTYEYGLASWQGKVAFTSSDPEVVRIDDAATGKAVTLETGTAVITGSYKGKTCTYTVEVVPEGTFITPISTRQAVALDEASKEILGDFDSSKVTGSTFYTAAKVANDFSVAQLSSMDVSGYGYECTEVTEDDYTYSAYTNNLAAPIYRHARYLLDALYYYSKNVSPISTTSAKCLKIKKVTAKKNKKKFTVTLNRKVTSDDISIVRYFSGGQGGVKKGATKATQVVYLCDKTTKKVAGKGKITFKAGSKKATVTVNKKLIKNHKYMIMTDEYGVVYPKGGWPEVSWLWTKGKTFKVK